MAVAGIRLRAAHAEDGGANRIAGEMTFRALVVRKVGHLGEGGGNFSRVRGKEPVRPAQHRILFMQYHWHPQEGGGPYCRNRGIATETDRDGCVQAFQMQRRLHGADTKLKNRFQLTGYTALAWAGGPDAADDDIRVLVFGTVFPDHR